MENFLETILSWPTWKRGLAWVASLALIVGGAWYLILGDLQAELVAAVVERDELVSKIQVEERLSLELPRAKQEVAELDRQLKELMKELPDKAEIYSLLSSISSLAKDAGLDVSLFKPRPEIVQDFYSEVPVSISVEGGFHQVATFFDEVGRLDRIVNISEIAMIDPVVDRETKDVRLKTSCTATTFRYLDEAERKAREEMKKKLAERR